MDDDQLGRVGPLGRAVSLENDEGICMHVCFGYSDLQGIY